MCNYCGNTNYICSSETFIIINFVVLVRKTNIAILTYVSINLINLAKAITQNNSLIRSEIYSFKLPVLAFLQFEYDCVAGIKQLI